MVVPEAKSKSPLQLSHVFQNKIVQYITFRCTQVESMHSGSEANVCFELAKANP